MSAQPLLDRATAALHGQVVLPKGSHARVAAWYARAALEQLTCEILTPQLTSDPDQMTMASRLTCLRVLKPTIGRDASHAWWALSRICHQHAFELTPTSAEVAHLVGRVAQLISASQAPQVDQSHS